MLICLIQNYKNWSGDGDDTTISSLEDSSCPIFDFVQRHLKEFFGLLLDEEKTGDLQYGDNVPYFGVENLKILELARECLKLEIPDIQTIVIESDIIE